MIDSATKTTCDGNWSCPKAAINKDRDIKGWRQMKRYQAGLNKGKTKGLVGALGGTKVQQRRPQEACGTVE